MSAQNIHAVKHRLCSDDTGYKPLIADISVNTVAGYKRFLQIPVDKAVLFKKLNTGSYTLALGFALVKKAFILFC